MSSLDLFVVVEPGAEPTRVPGLRIAPATLRGGVHQTLRAEGYYGDSPEERLLMRCADDPAGVLTAYIHRAGRSSLMGKFRVHVVGPDDPTSERYSLKLETVEPLTDEWWLEVKDPQPRQAPDQLRPAAEQLSPAAEQLLHAKSPHVIASIILKDVELRRAFIQLKAGVFPGEAMLGVFWKLGLVRFGLTPLGAKVRGRFDDLIFPVKTEALAELGVHPVARAPRAGKAARARR